MKYFIISLRHSWDFTKSVVYCGDATARLGGRVSHVSSCGRVAVVYRYLVSTGQYPISTVSVLSVISTDTCPVLTRGSAPHHSSTARITWSRTRATEGPLSSTP